MWKGKSVSVVMPTYKERGSIRSMIEDFDSLGVVDEIIVVNNNAEEGTDEEVRRTRAIVVREARQGYGYALQTGLRRASGDYVVTVEPDGTFVAADLARFLICAERYPVVFGSRTAQKTRNKDWGFWRREANIAYGGLIRVLFQTNMVTDVACTYKLMHRDVIVELERVWRHGSGLFATELLLLVVAADIPYIEIPITFEERVGSSTLVTSSHRLFKLGLVGLAQILGAWAGWIATRAMGPRRRTVRNRLTGTDGSAR